MKRSTKVLGLALAAAFALGASGCADDAKAPKASATAADSVDGATEFVAVPLGPGYVPALRSFHSFYLDDSVKQACGGADYWIDMTVEFGEVTPTSMHVDAVLVYYHAADPSQVIVPTTLDVYSREGTDVRATDDAFQPHVDGDAHRFEIDQDFPVDGSVSLDLDFHTSPGLPSGDLSDAFCEQLAQIAYYPEGTM